MTKPGWQLGTHIEKLCASLRRGSAMIPSAPQRKSHSAGRLYDPAIVMPTWLDWVDCLLSLLPLSWNP